MAVSTGLLTGVSLARTPAGRGAEVGAGWGALSRGWSSCPTVSGTQGGALRPTALLNPPGLVGKADPLPRAQQESRLAPRQAIPLRVPWSSSSVMKGPPGPSWWSRVCPPNLRTACRGLTGPPRSYDLTPIVGSSGPDQREGTSWRAHPAAARTETVRPVGGPAQLLWSQIPTSWPLSGRYWDQESVRRGGERRRWC